VSRMPGLRALRDGVVRYSLALGLFVLVWHAAAIWVGKPNTLPRPAEVFAQAIELVGSGELLDHVASTIRRLLAGFLIACGIGIPAGLAIGLSRSLAQYVTPLVEALRPISGIAWIPLALYALGIGEALPHFIIFYGAVFPVLINTAGAVRQVDPVLVNAALTLGASRGLVVRAIVFPACLPMIFVGARLGLGVGWMAVIASELVGAPSGLGYMIEWNRTMLMSSRVLVGVLTIGFLGYLMDWALRRSAFLMTPWWAGWRQHG
jgi:ABC-type nitrate/sulfonate/bicarbonate transport system permease component